MNDRAETWQINGLRLMRARYVRHAFKPHAHDYYVIGLIEAGVQSFDHGSTKHITTPGKLIIINPGEVHTGEAAIPTGFAYRALYPSVGLMETATREFDPDAAAKRLPSGTLEVPQLYSQLLALHRTSEHEPDSLALETAFRAFFHTLMMRVGYRPFTTENTHPHPAVSLARDYIEANYAQPITLTDLATHAAITPYHLARTFKRQLGVPPHKYLENVRIHHAERLLRQGIPISDVAYATGFSSQPHLTRTFREMMGITPGQYRKNL
ncbi:MAG: AraC family transcriptional regulator [Chloroflexota bacterium]